MRKPTTFTVAMPRPETNLFEVTMEVAPFRAPVESFDLVLPAWAPGSYAIRDFARHVRDLAVSDAAGEPLETAKTGKSRWRVSISRPARGPFTVRYRVFAHELSVRTSHLDTSHGYGNGTSLFFYVEGRKIEPQALRFVLPDGWRVSIALPGRAGLFRAASYDELVDSPFECGTHRTFEFSVRGVPHTLAIWGRGNEDVARLTRDLKKLIESAARLFGALPYERYLFLVHLAHGAGGGLEHRASQSVGIAPWKFRPEKSYRDVLLLLSHELFHAWNVKRIHPEALGPFDYTAEVHTHDLWAMEGITSYYESLLLARAGLLTPKQLFARWTGPLREHEESPGRRVQSAELASFDAWIRLYRPDENSPNVSESYYRRGALIGLALDLTLRRATKGTRSLDDVLRLLFREYGAKGRGYPEGTYERVVARFLGGSTAARFFDRHVRGVETPAFEALLSVAGLRLTEKPEKDEDDEEETAGKQRKAGTAKTVRRRADFGWKTRVSNGRLEVAEVYEGRAAYDAGINAGDELVAVNGVRADEEQLKRVERDVPTGSRVLVALFRRARLLEIPLILGARRAFTYEIAADGKASPAARRLFRHWTGMPFPVAKSKRRRR